MSTSTVDTQRKALVSTLMVDTPGEASVSMSTVDAQGRLLCPRQWLVPKGGFIVYVSG